MFTGNEVTAEVKVGCHRAEEGPSLSLLESKVHCYSQEAIRTPFLKFRAIYVDSNSYMLRN